MTPALRRIIAVRAHLAATGHLARSVLEQGCTERFAISLTRDGFRDEASGLEARLDHGFAVDGEEIVLTPRDNGGFDGACGATRFVGRAGDGGITLQFGDAWFHYEVNPQAA